MCNEGSTAGLCAHRSTHFLALPASQLVFCHFRREPGSTAYRSSTCFQYQGHQDRQAHRPLPRVTLLSPVCRQYYRQPSRPRPHFTDDDTPMPKGEGPQSSGKEKGNFEKCLILGLSLALFTQSSGGRAQGRAFLTISPQDF